MTMNPWPDGYFDAMMMVSEDQESERARQARYKRACEAYDGDYPIVPKDPNRNSKPSDFNMARKIVNTGVSFLFGKEQGITISTDESSRERNEQEQYLDKVLAANQFPLLLTSLGINGGKTGDPWLKLQRRSPKTGALPRVLALDPMNVQAFWGGDDIDDMFGCRIQWKDIDRTTGKPFRRRQEIVRVDDSLWTITDYIQRPGSTKWEREGEPERWPYPFGPVLHCQNLQMPNEFYGLADLDGDVLDMIEGINRTLTNLDRIMDNYGHPIVWGVGLPGPIDRAPNKIIAVGPGGSIHVDQPTGVDEPSINVYHLKKEALHEIAELPEVASGKVENVGQLSSLALKILYGPLLERTYRKRITYGAMITDLAKRLLALGDVAPYGSIEPVIRWPEVLPNDPVAEANTLEAHHRIGASQDTVLEKLGYDAEAERKKREVENAAAVKQAQAMAPPQQPGQPFGGQ